jgi:hypothetical protein
VKFLHRQHQSRSYQTIGMDVDELQGFAVFMTAEKRGLRNKMFEKSKIREIQYFTFINAHLSYPPLAVNL